jgi:hypothetical protein
MGMVLYICPHCDTPTSPIQNWNTGIIEESTNMKLTRADRKLLVEAIECYIELSEQSLEYEVADAEDQILKDIERLKKLKKMFSA